MEEPGTKELEWAKFHWDKWKEEAGRFWKHVAFGTIALIALGLYQLDVLQFNFASFKVISGIDFLSLKRWFICPVSIWIWLMLVFNLIDFLRHRVPEKFERYVHNNSYPVPFTKKNVNLKLLARALYIPVVLFYLLILAGLVAYTSIAVWR